MTGPRTRPSHGTLALLGALACSWAGCREPVTVESRREAAFTDVAAAAGITHSHSKPLLDPKLDPIMSWMASVGAAVAAADFNRDGWIDLYFTNSRKGEPNFLYRNEGDGTFREVAAAAGLAAVNGDDGVSMDAVWGDVDNDGWADLYLVRWGRDSLFRNNGDGTFSEVTGERFRRRDGGPGTDWANGNAAIFLDFDRDGRLDLYVGNYFRDDVDLWNLTDTRIMHDDFERSRNAGRNFLYHQQPDGSFVEVAEGLGLADTGWTLAVGAADLDGDAWPDLYSANDFGPDQLFLNLGDGAFRNVSAAALGYDTEKGMNVDFGDFNNDGWLDIYVTNITTAEYLQEGNMLWYNRGLGADGVPSFTDVALEAGTWDGGWAWGAKFLDYDNDGDADIASVNGFISAGEGSYWYDLASWTVLGDDVTDAANWPPIGERSFSGYERMRLWRNDGFGSFTEESRAEGLDSVRDGRGIATLDYDNDGDLDLAIANQGQPPHLYRNRASAEAHWLTLTLETDPTTGVNRDAIGARVTLATPDGLLVRERDGGNGYSGQSDPRLHFGLGDAAGVDLVEVRWPDGGVQYLEDVAADRPLTVRQDPALYAGGSRIERRAPRRPPADTVPVAAAPEIEPAELDRLLAELETGLRSPAASPALLSAYRARAATHGRHDRAIEFLAHLAEERDDPRLRIELSLAYVDKIPTCGGLAAVVCKGSLAKKGLDQLDRVLDAHPDSWLALYSRGMNHLHWPRALRHSDDAARDLERCTEIQAAGQIDDYQRRVWVALGQAYAKAGRYEEARDAWRRGLAVFPGDADLEAHLAIGEHADLLARVEDERSLERPIDTDVSFYPGEI